MPDKELSYSKNCSLSLQELQVIRKWLDKNLAKDFICKSYTQYITPLMLAAKSDDRVYICQDYCRLNNMTIKNRYLLFLIWEILDALCNAKFYIKLNIIAAFNKLCITEKHE
jgi:hypothetical protein